MKYFQCLELVPSLLRAGWTLSLYNKRIKWTYLNQIKQTVNHVYTWLKFSPTSPIVDEEEYWEKAYARAGKERPNRK